MATLRETGTYNGHSYAEASDKKGHSEVLQIRMQAADIERISYLVSSREYPFTNNSACARYLMFSHESLGDLLEHLGTPKAANELQQMLVMQRDREEEEKQGLFMKEIDFLDKFYADARQGDKEDLNDFILFLRKTYLHVERMPDGRWKRKFSKAMLSRDYGKYLKKKSKKGEEPTEIPPETPCVDTCDEK